MRSRGLFSQTTRQLSRTSTSKGGQDPDPVAWKQRFVPPPMEERSHSPRKTHSGQEVCVGRPVVKAHTSTRHGVEPVSSEVPEDQGGLLRPSDRLVRHPGEQQGSSVFLLTAPQRAWRWARMRCHIRGTACGRTPYPPTGFIREVLYSRGPSASYSW